MTLRCVPVEPTEGMRLALEQYYAKWQRITGTHDEEKLKADLWGAYHGYITMLAAAPPLPADIEAALELAKRLMRDDLLVPTTPCEEQLALALLKSRGKLP